MDKWGIRVLLFIDNKIVNLNMWNKSGVHLNVYDTTSLVNDFCHNMNAWQYEIC